MKEKKSKFFVLNFIISSCSWYNDFRKIVKTVFKSSLSDFWGSHPLFDFEYFLIKFLKFKEFPSSSVLSLIVNCSDFDINIFKFSFKFLLLQLFLFDPDILSGKLILQLHLSLEFDSSWSFKEFNSFLFLSQENFSLSVCLLFSDDSW